MRNMPEEFKKFCEERCIRIETDNEYYLAKEAWNKAVFICSEVVGEAEGVDYGIHKDFTIIE